MKMDQMFAQAILRTLKTKTISVLARIKRNPISTRQRRTGVDLETEPVELDSGTAGGRGHAPGGGG